MPGRPMRPWHSLIKLGLLAGLPPPLGQQDNHFQDYQPITRPTLASRLDIPVSYEIQTSVAFVQSLSSKSFPQSQSPLPPTSQSLSTSQLHSPSPAMCSWEKVTYEECGCVKMRKMKYSCRIYTRHVYGNCTYDSRRHQVFDIFSPGLCSPDCIYGYVDYNQ
ncbi:hypothetical protein N658DRAFT_560764 [Parathielavia hyrcaniae]|uniref:Uncharacterized protein n=1 Tax=Parathielavia hyrcaniae TaxID=113614 RepID=A0AAN6PW73_9PEZI|nr:hypothetical protein N658DRAFT_560764 [Parathielavia hyrcaniae]